MLRYRYRSVTRTETPNTWAANPSGRVERFARGANCHGYEGSLTVTFTRRTQSGRVEGWKIFPLANVSDKIKEQQQLAGRLEAIVR